MPFVRSKPTRGAFEMTRLHLRSVPHAHPRHHRSWVAHFHHSCAGALAPTRPSNGPFFFFFLVVTTRFFPHAPLALRGIGFLDGSWNTEASEQRRGKGEDRVEERQGGRHAGTVNAA